MTLVVLDLDIATDYIRQRRASGNDRWDEVWDGAYILMPNPNVEHQRLVARLVMAIGAAVEWAGLGQVFPGVNVSDQTKDWTRNYRCPDVAVYLNENPAVAHEAYWLGGPDFAVEIVSPDDRSRAKLDFYARVGVREILFIDRDPWALELYTRRGLEWDRAEVSTLDHPDPIRSSVLPLSFRLMAGVQRPSIEILHGDGVQKWVV